MARISNGFLAKRAVSNSEMERTRLTLIPVLLKTTIGGRQNSVVLQKLKPDTPYTITVSSLYPDGEGGRMTGRGKTSK